MAHPLRAMLLAWLRGALIILTTGVVTTIAVGPVLLALMLLSMLSETAFGFFPLDQLDVAALWVTFIGLGPLILFGVLDQYRSEFPAWFASDKAALGGMRRSRHQSR